MKRFPYIIIFLIFVNVFAQEIIENPEKPFNKNADRILKLEQVMRIDGEGEGYYFNGANSLKFDDEGNIYIRDFWHTNLAPNFLKFSPDGKFLKNLFKQGEGPGEIQSAFDFDVAGSEIYVLDMMKRKVVTTDKEGGFVKEFKLEADFFDEFIGLFGDWLVFLKKVPPYERKASRLYDDQMTILFISKDGQRKKEVFTFLRKTFYISLALGGGAMNWDPFISVLGEDGLIYACRTQEYKVEVLDLKSGKIINRFKRKYPRARYEMRKGLEDFIKRYNAPKRKFENDIQDLFLNKDFLWVKTSTVIKGKGTLFDIFDINGRFVDSVYINLSGRILRITGDYLFGSETDEEGLPSVVKYRMIGNEIGL